MSNKKITIEQVELYVATEPDKAKALEFLRELRAKRAATARVLFERGVRAGDHFKWQQFDSSQTITKQSWYLDIIADLVATINKAFNILQDEINLLTAGIVTVEEEINQSSAAVHCAGITSVEGQLHLPCDNEPIDGTPYCAEHPDGFKAVSTEDLDTGTGTDPD